MKSNPVHLVIVAAAFSWSLLSAGADEASYTSILKERETVLSQILAYHEGKRPAGLADEEAIATAQTSLYSFRRDIATTTAEKIKNQDLIVQILARKLEATQVRRHTGVAGDIEILEARALLLEAKQVSEELRLKKQEHSFGLPIS